jgi:hypothetical protein
LQEYDVALKVILRGSARLVMEQLGGGALQSWLDVELPGVSSPRVDLLGESGAGDLLHFELQSGNDAQMAIRMAEYSLRVFRQFGRFPQQVLLYVGSAPLRMETQLCGPDLWFRYRAVDIRDLDGSRLLDSDQVGDNILALLTRLHDEREAIRRVLHRIAGLPAGERENSFQQLMLLAGLRQIEETIEEEAKRMPILNDILEHKVLGREYKRGRQEEAIALVRRLIEKRFGTLPGWAEERLASRSSAELEELGLQVLDARTLEELLP